MVDDFLVRAMVAGVGAAVVAGPLGCFIVWRRMAYFGGTMAHSALLGVALGFLLEIDLTLGVIVVTITVAVLLIALQNKPWLSSDTLLGILAHAALSLGLIVLSLMAWLRLDLLGYLFGDILAVSRADIAWIYGGGLAVLACLAAIWRPLLASLRPWANITLLDLPGCAPGLAGCDETELPALLDAVLAVAPARAV